MNAICCSENLDFFIVFPRQCQPKHYGKILTSDGPVSGDQVIGLAAFRPFSNLKLIYQRSDNVHGLRARRVVGQKE